MKTANLKTNSMENTEINKAKFYGLYFGQKVLKAKITNVYSIDKETSCMNVLVEPETIKDHWFLELTPLSQITDEVAISVDFMSATHFINVMKSYGADFNGLLLKHEHIDILRYNGYAVDWMGLSVEELVSFGWVKLKQI